MSNDKKNPHNSKSGKNRKNVVKTEQEIIELQEASKIFT